MKKIIFLLHIALLLLLSGCLHTSTTNQDISDITYTQDFNRLFDETMYHKITIEISEYEWNGLIQDMLDYQARYNDLRSDTYFMANMIYEDEIGTITVNEIGFRTKGNLSRVLPQNSNGSLNLAHFKIKFDETFSYEKESKKYKILNDRTVFDLEEINLKYNRNFDEAYISELYSYELFNKVGVWAPEATLVDFYIKIGDNLVHYGIYTMFEPIDKKFIKRRVEAEEDEGNLYKCLWQQFGPASLSPINQFSAIGIKDVENNYRPAYDLKTNKKEADFTDLQDFITVLNSFEGEAFIDFIEDNFEVDNFLKLLAMGVLIGNPDDYRGNANNYYLYHNNLTNKFMMIPFDYDHSLGQGWSSEFLPNYSIGSDIYDWGHTMNVTFPLVDKILNIPQYKEQYTEYLRQFIDPGNNIFEYELFKEKLEMYTGIYDMYVNSSMQKLHFGERNASWYFEQKISDINNQLRYYDSLGLNEVKSDVSA